VRTYTSPLFGGLNFSTITEGLFIIHAQYNCNTGVPY